MDFNRYITASEFSALAELFRREGRSIAFARGGVVCLPGGAEPPLRCGRAGRLPLRAPHRTGRAACGGLRLCRGVRWRLHLDEQRPACLDRHRGDVRQPGAVPRQRPPGLLYATDAAHEQLGRTLAEHLLAEVYERLLQCYASTPQERYEALLRRCPDLLHLVPLKEPGLLPAGAPRDPEPHPAPYPLTSDPLFSASLILCDTRFLRHFLISVKAFPEPSSYLCLHETGYCNRGHVRDRAGPC